MVARGGTALGQQGHWQGRGEGRQGAGLVEVAALEIGRGQEVEVAGGRAHRGRAAVLGFRGFSHPCLPLRGSIGPHLGHGSMGRRLLSNFFISLF